MTGRINVDHSDLGRDPVHATLIAALLLTATLTLINPGTVVQGLG